MNSNFKKFEQEMQNNQSNWINFIHFMNYLKKKKIIYNNTLYNYNANIKTIYNNLKTVNTSKKYGIVLEKNNNKYKVLILKDDKDYMEKLAIYFLKNLTQSFSSYCFAVTHSKISLHCEPNINKEKVTPKALCIPRNNIYIKEIELESNMEIGSKLNVSNNNKITLPTNQESKQNGGFGFGIGIFGGIVITRIIDVLGMDRRREEERRRKEEKKKRRIAQNSQKLVEN